MIQPANPQVVYVPQYNPTVVYGAPVAVPFYVPPPLPVASVGLYFGAASRLEPWFGRRRLGRRLRLGLARLECELGLLRWRRFTTIIYNNNTYINNRTWNNTNYNGYHPWAGGAAGSQNHAWYGANGTFHPDGNYKPGEDTHYGPNGGYHPNGYFGPDGGWRHPDKNACQNLPNGETTGTMD